MNANEIKTYLIDYLISGENNSIIGSEITFGFGKNVADIIQLINGKIYSYEIKGDKDDFRRLPHQLQSYKKVFDYVYIVVTSKHMEHCDVISDDIGILLINDQYQITLKRKAKLQKTKKEEILETINSRFLKTFFNILGNKTSADIRKIVLRKNLPLIKSALYSYYSAVITPRYKIFLDERGENTHMDDIPILTLHNRLII